jgi:hypothetical protein
VKRRTILLVAAIVASGGGLLWFLWVQPELNYRRIVRMYPPGTPAQRLLQDYGGNVQLHKSQNLLGREPTEYEKSRYVGYYLDLPHDNACVFFNYRQELLGVMRWADAMKPQ